MYWYSHTPTPAAKPGTLGSPIDANKKRSSTLQMVTELLLTSRETNVAHDAVHMTKMSKIKKIMSLGNDFSTCSSRQR